MNRELINRIYSAAQDNFALFDFLFVKMQFELNTKDFFNELEHFIGYTLGYGDYEKLIGKWGADKAMHIMNIFFTQKENFNGMKKVKVEFEIMVPETVTPEHLGEWLNFMLDISEDYPQYENPLNLCAFRHVAPSNIKFEM